MQIVTIETPSLGDRSYVVTDGSAAIVIDPQRDIDRLLEVVRRRGCAVRAVFETHNHNDYVTGGFELARATGAIYALPADEEMFFDFHGLRDNDELTVGRLRIRAVHTPGHTPTHLSYVVTDPADGDQVRSAVFTGGSLLYGSVGRTDLVSQALRESLTRQQYASAWRLANELSDDTPVFPTHGFGSFCSSAAADEQSSAVDPKFGVETSTIGEQRRANLALTITDEAEFVERLLAGLDAFPRYYAHMAPRNKVGPGPIDLTPAETADPAELARRIHVGEWVVDLRSRTAYAADHVVGTINLEVGNSLVTYLAWLIPWGTPVTLVGDTQDAVNEAQRQLVRVGIERPAAQAVGGIDAFGAGLQRAEFPVRDFAALRAELAHHSATVVLDVRRHDERRTGGIAGSVHIPIHELERRAVELPAGEEIWVHCASGYRAAIAASLLVRAGRRVVLVDDDDTQLFGLDFVLTEAA